MREQQAFKMLKLYGLLNAQKKRVKMEHDALEAGLGFTPADATQGVNVIANSRNVSASDAGGKAAGAAGGAGSGAAAPS